MIGLAVHRGGLKPAAAAAGSWAVTGVAADVGNSPGWSGYTMRIPVLAADLAAGSKVRFTFESADTVGMVIGAAYVGFQSGTFGYSAPPLQLFFGGSPGVSVGAAASVVSDERAIALPGGTNLVVAVFFSGSSNVMIGSGLAATQNWWKFGNDAANVSPTGYTGGSVDWCLKTVEVYSP